jgi:hypothetical protein
MPEDTPKPNTTTLAPDDEDVNVAEALDELNVSSEDATKETGEEAPKTPAVDSALTARLDKIEEENISLRQRVDIQNGQMSILRQQSPDQKPTEPPPLKRIKIPSREELAAKLSDPNTAVQGMHELLSDLGTQFQDIIDETRDNAERNFRTRDFSTRLNTALSEDQRTTVEEYGQDLIRDPDFIRDADAEGDKLGRRRGHTNYTPGDFNLLATRTYKNWLESGKLDDWKTKRAKTENGRDRQPTNGRTPSLREVTRSVGRSDFVDTSNGRGAEASSLADLYNGDAREIRIARANMKKMGLSEKEWITSFKASKSEDPSFGQ